MEYTRFTQWTENGASLILDNPQNAEEARTQLMEKFKLACNKLAELEDKIEQGTLKELPCKVGDTVYIVYAFSGILEWEVMSIDIMKKNILFRLGHKGTNDYNSALSSEMGETLFSLVKKPRKGWRSYKMDKQKQIEEIEKNRVAELRLFYGFCKYNGCDENTAEDCENCYFRKVYNRLAELEGEIRNGTLKEIPENAVVLSRSEREDLFTRRELELVREQAYKRSAKIFAQRLKDEYLPIVSSYFLQDDPNQFELENELCDLTDETCKEITEGKI